MPKIVCSGKKIGHARWLRAEDKRLEIKTEMNNITSLVSRAITDAMPIMLEARRFYLDFAE